MIIINFKLYKNTFGNGAVELAKMCRKVKEETGVEIAVAVSAIDVYRIKKETNLMVFCQNIDLYQQGAKTGWISAKQLKEIGIEGALVNHSEHKISSGKIKQIIKNKPKNFEVVLCVRSVGQVEKWASKLTVDCIAYEPSYLIGSKDKSIASEKADSIEKIVKLCPDKKILVGAGIKSSEDIIISVEKGAKGVLIASSIVKAKNLDCAYKNLTKIAKAFK